MLGRHSELDGLWYEPNDKDNILIDLIEKSIRDEDYRD